MGAVAAARAELSQAEIAHACAVADARRELGEAEKRREIRIRAAEKELGDARTGKLLAGYGNAVRVYDNRIETPEGTARLSEAIDVKVESSGRWTSEADTRELYVLIDTPQFASVVQCHPDRTPAHELAAAIKTAAKNAKTLIRDHDAGEAAAKKRLADVQADRTEVEAAAAKLEALEVDLGEIEAAATALAEAEADRSEIEAREHDLLAIDPAANLPRASAPRRLVRAVTRPFRGRPKQHVTLAVADVVERDAVRPPS